MNSALFAQAAPPASKPDSHPAIAFKIFRTGEEKKPIWNVSSGELKYGSVQIRNYAKEKEAEYKLNVLGLAPKAPKFDEAICETTILVDADPGAPFGFIHTIIEAFVVAKFHNFEFTGAATFSYSVPTLEHVKKVDRLDTVRLLLTFVEGHGVVRAVSRAPDKPELREVSTEDEVVNRVDQIWKKNIPPKGSERVATFSISSSVVPWKDVSSVWKRITDKGVDQIELSLPDNLTLIPDQPREKK